MAGESSERKRVTLIVSGRVQGVGFRYFVAEAATALGVVGTVRNLHNGDVEVVAEGPEEDLRRLLQEVRCGPPMARVEEVQVTWGRPTGDYTRFRVTY